MAAPKTEKKKRFKKNQGINTYFALRSKNELYYQMASVFKAVTKDKEELTQEMIGALMSIKNPNFFVENKL